jgi:hypothetical protein
MKTGEDVVGQPPYGGFIQDCQGPGGREPLFMKEIFDLVEKVQGPVGVNPKDLLGISKVSMTKVSPIALAHEALAMMDGAEKYGPYNWRDNKVIASIYVDALMRHVWAWFDGEETAQDSGVHHLGHARACLNILLDAQATDCLHDDRPKNGAMGKVLAELNAKIKAKSAEKNSSDIHFRCAP